MFGDDFDDDSLMHDAPPLKEQLKTVSGVFLVFYLGAVLFHVVSHIVAMF